MGWVGIEEGDEITGVGKVGTEEIGGWISGWVWKKLMGVKTVQY